MIRSLPPVLTSSRTRRISSRILPMVSFVGGARHRKAITFPFRNSDPSRQALSQRPWQSFPGMQALPSCISLKMLWSFVSPLLSGSIPTPLNFFPFPGSPEVLCEQSLRGLSTCSGYLSHTPRFLFPRQFVRIERLPLRHSTRPKSDPRPGTKRLPRKLRYISMVLHSRCDKSCGPKVVCGLGNVFTFLDCHARERGHWTSRVILMGLCDLISSCGTANTSYPSEGS